MKEYKIGEKYWVKNPRAGRNTQSCFELVKWENAEIALMYNKRYGFVRVSRENLDAHN